MRQNKQNRLLDLFRRKEKLQPMVEFYEKPEIANLFNQVENDIIFDLKKLPLDDAVKRDALFYELRCIERVKQKIMSYFNEMQVVNHNIEVENGRDN